MDDPLLILGLRVVTCPLTLVTIMPGETSWSMRLSMTGTLQLWTTDKRRLDLYFGMVVGSVHFRFPEKGCEWVSTPLQFGLRKGVEDDLRQLFERLFPSPV